MKRIILYVLFPLVAGCTCSNSNKSEVVNELTQKQVVESATQVVESATQVVESATQVVESATQVVESATQVVESATSEEDNYIMTPGITYVTTTSQTKTDEFGGKVSISMEFTIYKDGSASGNLIETNESSSYGNSNSYNHPVEGTWREVSKRDKRFVEIKLILEGDEYYNWFYYYVDEELNAYANDINTRPIILEKK